MLRYANEDRTIIVSDEHPGMGIPVDARNAQYREIVEPILAKGGTIEPLDANAGGGLGARKKKKASELREELLDRLVTSTSPADTLRATARAVGAAIQAANTRAELDAIDVKNW